MRTLQTIDPLFTIYIQSFFRFLDSLFFSLSPILYDDDNDKRKIIALHPLHETLIDQIFHRLNRKKKKNKITTTKTPICYKKSNITNTTWCKARIKYCSTQNYGFFYYLVLSNYARARNCCRLHNKQQTIIISAKSHQSLYLPKFEYAIPFLLFLKNPRAHFSRTFF